jgi:hypothetical protein
MLLSPRKFQSELSVAIDLSVPALISTGKEDAN